MQIFTFAILWIQPSSSTEEFQTFEEFSVVCSGSKRAHFHGPYLKHVEGCPPLKWREPQNETTQGRFGHFPSNKISPFPVQYRFEATGVCFLFFFTFPRSILCFFFYRSEPSSISLDLRSSFREVILFPIDLLSLSSSTKDLKSQRFRIDFLFISFSVWL